MLKLSRFVVLLLATCGAFVLAPHTSGRSQEYPGCFLINKTGNVRDLSEICPVPQSADDPVLGTGDVQLTLRWSTKDDLDLAVIDPSQQKVSFQQPRVTSGGQLDVDSNAGCAQNIRTNPVENVFWPTSGAPSGNYTVEVNLYQRCTSTTGPIQFTLTILVGGQTMEKTGQVDDQNLTVSFPFSFPATGTPAPSPAP